MLGLAIIGAREHGFRAVLAPCATLLAAWLLSRGLYAVVGSPGEVEWLTSTGQPRVLALAAQGPVVEWFLTPSMCSVACGEQLRAFFGARWQLSGSLIAAVALLAQVWFWWTAFRVRPTALALAAVVMMLAGYGYVAGILYGRVAEYGTAYLFQPRYVIVYMTLPLALLMMAAAWVGSGQAGRLGRGLVAAGALSLVAIQAPMAVHSWERGPYMDAYYRKMAQQLFLLASEPAAPPEDCVRKLVVCDWEVEDRVNAFAFLRRHRLNLFSQEFVDRHGLQDALPEAR